jgi:hypothetical protein
MSFDGAKNPQNWFHIESIAVPATCAVSWFGMSIDSMMPKYVQNAVKIQ